jgi:hypothetical protein
MTTEKKLQAHFDGQDISALLEVLQMWKNEPANLLDVFIEGILTLELQQAEDGLRKFSANFKVAADVLGDTEDGRHFSHLYCVVNSYMDLLDLKQDVPQNILN